MSIPNEYDITKKMLNIVRKNQMIGENKITKSFINEQTVEPEKDEVSNINDVDVRIISSDRNFEIDDNDKNELSTLIDSFREQVSQIADLNPGITIKEDQIRLDGEYANYDLKFVYIGGLDSGVYFTTNMCKLDSELMLFIDKLHKFEETFKDVIEPLIRERKSI